MTDTTYILVHGGWSGAWCWRDVGAELTLRNVAWSAVDLPSSTNGALPNTYLGDDARDVIEVANLEGPVVLVGHSYGGCVIAEAAEKIPNLERLVYVAALVPLLGQGCTEASREVKVRTKLDDAIEVDGEYLFLNPERAEAALYQDCENETVQWAISQHTTQTIASFRSPRSSFDVDVPSRYIACTQDNAIDPSVQEVMASRCSEVMFLNCGHSPMFSRPSSLVDLILSPTL
jgi:pimeloyl-ACP methyl ester carboxylesterase